MMTKKVNKANAYHLPIKFSVKYNLILIIGCIYLNLCFVGVYYLFLFYKPITKDDLQLELLLLIIPLFIFSCLTFIADIDFIHSSILHRQYVEINHDGIIIRKLFKKIELKWSDIYLVDFYTFRMAELIRITSCKHRTVNRYLMSLGKAFGFFYVGINLRKYSSIDINKFMNTIDMNI